jgi:hypothetical protein
MEELDQKRNLCFVDRDTSNYQAHKASQDVAMVADERKVRYLAKVLDFDHVHVLGFRVATLRFSPYFVFMHIFIL